MLLLSSSSLLLCVVNKSSQSKARHPHQCTFVNFILVMPAVATRVASTDLVMDPLSSSLLSIYCTCGVPPIPFPFFPNKNCSSSKATTILLCRRISSAEGPVVVEGHAEGEKEEEEWRSARRKSQKGPLLLTILIYN